MSLYQSVEGTMSDIICHMLESTGDFNTEEQLAIDQEC